MRRGWRRTMPRKHPRSSGSCGAADRRTLASVPCRRCLHAWRAQSACIARRRSDAVLDRPASDGNAARCVLWAREARKHVRHGALNVDGRRARSRRAALPGAADGEGAARADARGGTPRGAVRRARVVADRPGHLRRDVAAGRRTDAGLAAAAGAGPAALPHDGQPVARAAPGGDAGGVAARGDRRSAVAVGAVAGSAGRDGGHRRGVVGVRGPVRLLGLAGPLAVRRGLRRRRGGAAARPDRSAHRGDPPGAGTHLRRGRRARGAGRARPSSCSTPTIGWSARPPPPRPR